MQGSIAAGASALIAIVVYVLPAGAADDPSVCPRAAAVTGGDQLMLAQPVAGSREVRLAGILAVDGGEMPAGAATRAGDARRALAEIVDGHCLTLIAASPNPDRYGRLVAGLRRDDGISIEGELVRRGLARVLPGLGDAALPASLLASEDAARRAGAGLWADPRFRVRTPETAGADVGSFQLVEGRVLRAQRVGPRLYLNFGEDWQTDFTVVIAARTLPRFAAAGVDPAALSGRSVRVRGIIEDLNGPMIEIEEPAALEVLDPG